MVTMEQLSTNNRIDRMLDKETIGKWIGELKLPLAIYLRDNLKSSGPNWFQTGVIEKIKSSEMKKIATKSRDIKSLDEKIEFYLKNPETTGAARTTAETAGTARTSTA